MTVTEQTHQSVYNDGGQRGPSNQIDARQGSTLHEDTIESWKVQRHGHREGSINMTETPELTDDQVTIIDRKDNIGEGPIFIKKSTDFNTSNRRRTNRLGSQKNLLGGTMD